MRSDRLSSGVAPSLAGYARTLWLLKGCSVGLLISLALNFGQLAVTYSLFPLVRTEPMYVEFQSGGNNFVRVVRTDAIQSRLSVLISVALRKYLVDRETIDRITESARYQRVVHQSNDETEVKFRAGYSGKNSFLDIESFHRTVMIKRDNALTNDIHQIEFETHDYYENRDNFAEGGVHRPFVKEWIATMRYRLVDEHVAYDEQHLNPLGLYVVNYDLTQRVSTSAVEG